MRQYLSDGASVLLGDKEGQKLLQTTLEEGRQTDQKLSKLAASVINVAAAK
jgi:ferritin-like metal-binding protein YciE